MAGVDWLWAPLKKSQFGRYFVITLNEETLRSGLVSDSLLFPNPASPGPVRGEFTMMK